LSIISLLFVFNHSLNKPIMSQFKYENFFRIHDITNCPPKNYKALNLTAYRYVFDDLEDERNFKPVYLLDENYPKRLNSTQDLTLRCKGFGLSLYQDKNGAINNYRRWIAKTNGKFAKIVGSFVATIQILETDGVCSDIENEDSHFTFHVYETVNFLEKIEGNPYLMT
jgi:hypothetical protein